MNRASFLNAMNLRLLELVDYYGKPIKLVLLKAVVNYSYKTESCHLLLLQNLKTIVGFTE